MTHLRDKIKSGLWSFHSSYPTKSEDLEEFVNKWTGFLLAKICEERGCEPEGTKNIFHPELGPMQKLGKGPCIWCDRKEVL